MISSTSDRSQADQVALAVSLVFHPLIVVIPTLVIALVQTGQPLLQALLWTLLAVLVVNLPMAFLIYSGVHSGRYSDASVSIREQRSSVYAVGGACLVALLLILFLGNAPAVLTACLVSALLATAIGYAINRYTKLSLHAAAIAGCAVVLLWTAPLAGGVMAGVAPLVGWARMRLNHHTLAQILIGWLIPSVCVFVVFQLIL